MVSSNSNAHTPLQKSYRGLTAIFLVLIGTAFGSLLSPPSSVQALPDRPHYLTSVFGPGLFHEAMKFSDIKLLLKRRQTDQAVAELKQYIAESPDARNLDEAYFLLGSLLYRSKSYSESVDYLTQFVQQFPKSKLIHRGRMILARAHGALEQTDQALRLLSEVRSLAPNTRFRREALALTGTLLTKKGDPLRAIQAWLEEMRITPADQQPIVRDRIRDLIMQLPPTSLLRVRDGYRVEFPGDLALIRLAEIHQERKEQHLVERHLNTFLKRFPTHEYAPTAKDLLQSYSLELREAQHVLVALLPLSGRLSPFGTDALRGIQLAMEKGKEIYNLSSIALAVRDSESDKFFLRSELYKLINDFQPLAVIGPLESRQVQTLAELAERTETPFITPSASLPNVRRLGNYMFSTSLTYNLQVKQLVDYALFRAGYRQIGILHPKTVYGKKLSQLFMEEIRKRGGDIIGVESYNEKDTDFGQQIKQLKAEDLARDGTFTETEGKDGEMKPVYDPGFDAIFIPGRAREVALISAQLVFFDIKTPLLGTNGWNAPSLLRLADRSIDGSVFVDGFYLGSRHPDIQDFIDRYKQRFKQDPSPFAAQAYDAAFLVLNTVHGGATNAREVQPQLLNRVNLPTLGGTARFDERGILDRPLHLLQIQGGKIQPVQDPTPTPEPIP